MRQDDALRLLIVEDDDVLADVMATLAEGEGYRALVARTGPEALAIGERFEPDALLTDLHLPGLDGNGVLRALRQRDPALPAVVLTAFPAIETAVEAMRAGALDYVTKPADWTVIRDALARSLRRRAILADERARRGRLRERLGIGFGRLLGTSPAMRRVFADAARAASSRATVLLTGESGTGKSAMARLIHDISNRQDGPFVALHCAALTESLVESELFGHEAGAFTGAEKQRIGRFEQANGGTLFIDEVAEIPMVTQTKLLGVLQDRVFDRVGGSEPVEVDVRVVAATNADLAARVRDGRFREDLFYRLHVVAIEVPALRERGDDTLLLAQRAREHHARINGKDVRAFTAGAVAKLLDHDWPGNVRELENAVERAVILATSHEISADLIDIEHDRSEDPPIPGATLKEIELAAIRATFEATGSDTRRTAEILGMPPRTVQYRLKELGLSRPRGRPSKRPPASTKARSA